MEPVLFVFDGLTTLPQLSEPLLAIMGNRHAHLVVLYQHYRSPDKLVRSIDHKLLRGSKVHVIEPLTMIHSTQRTVYSIQSELDLAPDNNDQVILERLAEFTSGSPDLVDITTQLVLASLREEQSCDQSSVSSNTDHTSHKALEKFARSVALDMTRQSRVVGTSYFKMRSISEHMKGSVPTVSTLLPEQRDGWDTKCQYDSWDSISELLGSCNLRQEEELLLNCLSIYGASPVPKLVVTALSALICRTLGKPHLATSLLQKLVQMSFVKKYPFPVVMHSSLHTHKDDMEFVYVPQYMANFIWKAMSDGDKVFALATSSLVLSSLPPHSQHTARFLLGLTLLLMDAYELNSEVLSESCFKDSYTEVYKLYISFLRDSHAK